MNKLAVRLVVGVACASMAFTAAAFKISFFDTSVFGLNNKRIHEDITLAGLKRTVYLDSWTPINFDDRVAAIVAEENTENDENGILNPVLHFDEDNFDASSTKLNELRDQIVDILLSFKTPATFSLQRWQARESLGIALHTIQDFYAHSNWVETKQSIPALPLPNFGDKDPFSAIKLMRPLASENLAAVACTDKQLKSDAPLTTGYYLFAMSGAFFRGFDSIPAPNETILSEGYVVFETLTQEKRNALGLYGDQWARLYNRNWPDARCIHGGDEGPRLNKDAPSSDPERNTLHESARQYAIEASAKFVQNVITELKNRGGASTDLAICEWMGKTGTACEPQPVATVTGLRWLETTPIVVGVPFLVLVDGSRLSPYMKLTRVSTLDQDKSSMTCEMRPALNDANLVGFNCKALEAGSAPLKAMTSDGIELFSKPLTVHWATPAYSPETATIFETITFTVSKAIDAVKAVIWAFGDGVAQAVARVTGGVSEAVSHIFTSAGEKMISVTYKEGLDSAARTLGTASFKLTVEDGGVGLTTAIVGIKTSTGVEIPDNGNTTEKRPQVQGTISAPLLNTFFYVDVLIDGSSVGQAAVDGTAWTYTPPSDLGAGSHAVTARVARGDGVFGTQSAAWRLTVLPSSTSQLFDEFTGTTIDTSTWTIDGFSALQSGGPIGPVAIAGGVAQFGAYGRISTKNKVTFSGNKIVIEARMAGQGGSRDTSIALVDAATGDYLYSGDTNYCGWGLFASGSGGYELTSGALECGGSNKVKHVGTSTNAFMEYRWTIVGNQLTVERGTTLANITETLTATLGRSIDGRSFYLSIGTAGPSYSPGTWDWVRVSTQGGTSAQQSYSLAGDFSPTSNPRGSWTYGWSATLGGPLNLFDTAGSPVVDRPYPGLSFWRANTPYSLWIVKNTGASVVSDGWINIAPGDIHMSPGLNNEYAIARWKATVAGSYRVQGRFALYEAGGTVDVHVFKNGVQLDGALLQTAGTKERTFNLAINVAVGDLIDFVVGNAGDGHVGDDPIVSVSIVPQ